MLHQLLKSNRKEIARRCREKAAMRFASVRSPEAIDHGVPLFLEQLIDVLYVEHENPNDTPEARERTPAATEIGRAAALHGAELLRRGYSIGQVVHDYGDICQAVTEMAISQGTPISASEFRTLNRCLDNAIADAVTSFGRAREDQTIRDASALQQSLDQMCDEQRRLIEIATQAYLAIKTGNVGLTGATGTLLMHALQQLAELTERTVQEMNVTEFPSIEAAAHAAR